MTEVETSTGQLVIEKSRSFTKVNSGIAPVLMVGFGKNYSISSSILLRKWHKNANFKINVYIYLLSVKRI